MSQSKENLRILLSAYACEPDRGSEPGVGWHWALTLVKRGHDVWVLTRANNRISIEKAVERVNENERVRLRFIYYDLPAWAAWWKRGGRGVQLYYLLWQRNILPLVETAHNLHDFDVIHHLTFGVWRQPTQLYKLGVPLIFGPVGGGETTPGNLVSTLPFTAKSWEWTRYLANIFATFNPRLRACLRGSRWVIAKTKETAGWLRLAGVNSSTSFEIGIDATRCKPRTERRSDNSMKCLFAGRLIGLKGVHLAIEALANARARDLDVSLTVVGKGPMRKRLKDLANQLGVTDHVEFVEWLDQTMLFEQYRLHDVLLFPSLHDSSGNVILEAFAHALPAVCLNLGGPGEMVDSSTGIVVEADNNPVVGLANALLRLAADPELRARLGVNARAKAVTTTWEKVVATVYEPVERTLLTTPHTNSISLMT